jgi:hypothetical protein
MISDCAQHRRNETKLYVLCAVYHSHLPCGLRRTSAASRLLKMWVRIPPRAWMSVCCECCVLSGRGLCDEPITRPEESYQMWCVVVCDLETSWMRRPWPNGGCCVKRKNHSHTNLVRYIKLSLFNSSIIPLSPVWLTIYGKSYVYLHISQGKRLFGSCPSLESSDVLL